VCGISGAFAFDQDAKPVDSAIILRLNEVQRRRGPDGGGLWSSSDHRIVLGHRRLAIIDTGTSGTQPMWDASGRWVISFNGEIYNYQALRSELELQGCVFLTNSDTEVVINVVAKWGESGLRKLRGMYAFGLWDTLDRELWLVRDPFGIKPLYLSDSQGTIWFASQARALATCAPVDTRRDPAALTGLYLWGHVPEPFSWWAGIRSLPPGHVQRIRAGYALSPARQFHYIQDAYIQEPIRPLDPGQLRQLMLDSIQHHLVADVCVGVFLSAGVDSSIIAALTAELGSPLRTITIGFDEYAGTPNDEVPLAEATARLLRSDHTTVRISRDEFEGCLDDFLKCMDQPTTDGLNTYLVSRATAALGLKVALSGLGGDELFGGYPSFRHIPRLLRWGRYVPGSKTLGGTVQSAFRKLLPGIPPKTGAILSHSCDIAHAYLLRRALYLEDELDALLDESWLNEGMEKLSTVSALGGSISRLSEAGATTHAQIAALESCWYMRNQLLRDTDWGSMAHGLEVRVPFVDAHLLERLGPAIASHNPPTKKDLGSCSELLIPAVLGRAKTGFSTPVNSWLTQQTRRSSRGLRGWVGEVHRKFGDDEGEGGLMSERESYSREKAHCQISMTTQQADFAQNRLIDRVLIFRQGSIGDFVVSLPCLHNVRKKFPRAQIALLTNHPMSSVAAPAKSVLDGAGLIDQYITYRGGTRDLRELAKIRLAIASFSPEILIYLAQPQGVLSTYRDYLFFRSCGIRSVIGLTLTHDLQDCRQPALGSALWESEASRLGRSLGVCDRAELERSVNWTLNLTTAEIEEAMRIIGQGLPSDQCRKGFLGLSIGTKQKINDWGNQNWLAVLKGLSGLDLGLVLIGAAEERARSQKLADEWHGPTLNLCGQISPRVSAAVMKQMIILLCHDSGPMHLAASVGTRCVAVFSRRNPPGKWFPFGKGHRILYPPLATDTIQSVEPTQVIAATNEILSNAESQRKFNSGIDFVSASSAMADQNMKRSVG
jgi:asparagine synthase (glutamine-hydrolysing)